MKCQSLFSERKRKVLSVCCLLNLPRSDLGLHCLLRSVCPKTCGKYDYTHWSCASFTNRVLSFI